MTTSGQDVPWLSEGLRRKIEQTHDSVSLTLRLQLEIQHLLAARLLHFRYPRPESDDPVKNLMNIQVHGLIIDDVILRLVKLCDKRSDTLTFKKVLKAQKNRLGPTAVAALLGRINEYGAFVSNLKSHRDGRIAHTQIGANTNLPPTTEIREAVKMAVEISDSI